MRASGPTLGRYTGAWSRVRALSHTPNYLRDRESCCGLADRAVTQTQGAGRLCKAVSFLSFPSVSFHLMVKQQQSFEKLAIYAESVSLSRPESENTI